MSAPLPTLSSIQAELAERRAEVSAVEGVLNDARETAATLGRARDKAQSDLDAAMLDRGGAETDLYLASHRGESTAKLETIFGTADARVRAKQVIAKAAAERHGQAANALAVAEGGAARGKAEVARLEALIAWHPETTRAASAPLLAELLPLAESIRTIVTKLDAIGHAARKAGGRNPADQWHVYVPIMEMLADSGRALDETGCRDLRYSAKFCDPDGHPRKSDPGAIVSFIWSAWSKPPATAAQMRVFREEIERMKRYRTYSSANAARAAEDLAVDRARTQSGIDNQPASYVHRGGQRIAVPRGAPVTPENIDAALAAMIPDDAPGISGERRGSGAGSKRLT